MFGPCYVNDLAFRGGLIPCPMYDSSAQGCHEDLSGESLIGKMLRW